MAVAGGVVARGGGDCTTGVSQPLTELLSRRSPSLLPASVMGRPHKREIYSHH